MSQNKMVFFLINIQYILIDQACSVNMAITGNIYSSWLEWQLVSS